MYGKIFDSIYDGTLVENWQALVTFQQMIVLADADGMLDMTPRALSARTGIPLEIIEAGIAVLEAPDPHSRTPDQDGRRIERIDEHRTWGWHLINHAKYKHLKDASEVRAQNRERQQRFRDRMDVTLRNSMSRDVTLGNTKSRHTDTDTDTKKPLGDKSPLDGFEIVWKALPKRAGNNPKRKALSAYRARIAEKHTPVEILDGAARYARYVRATGKEGTEYVMQAATFLGPEKAFLQEWAVANGASEWWKTEPATIAKGRELNLPARPGETMEEYRQRLRDRIAA